MQWLGELLNDIWVAVLATLAAVTGMTVPPARFQGYVEAEYVRIAASDGGTLRQLLVERGDRVEVGQPLFLLEDDSQRMARDEAAARLRQSEAEFADLGKGSRTAELEAIEAQLVQAEASLRLSAVRLRREEQLVARKVSAQERLDEARAAHQRDRARVAELEALLDVARLAARDDRVAAAEAAVGMAQAALDRADWDLGERAATAPAAGLVSDTFYREGEEVPPGGAVLSLLPPGNVKLRFFVPEPKLSSLAIGQTVAIGCDSCAPGLTGTVTFISPEAEFTPPVIFSNETRAKLVFMVEARPEGKARRLQPGQPVDVALVQP